MSIRFQSYYTAGAPADPNVTVTVSTVDLTLAEVNAQIIASKVVEATTVATVLAEVDATVVQSNSQIGDVYIGRQTTGGTNYDSTTYTDFPYNTQVKADAGTFTKQSDTLIRCAKAGHYLMLYNAALETSAGSNRSNRTTRITVGATSFDTYGKGSGYIRRSGGADECFISAGAIIETTADDTDVGVEIVRKDTETANVASRSNESGIALVRLDDTAPYLRRSATDSLAIGAGTPQAAPTNTSDLTFTKITFGTSDEQDTGYGYSNGDITLNEAGTYLVCYSVECEMSDSVRKNVISRLTLDGSEVQGSMGGGYLRGSNAVTTAVCSWFGLVTTTTADEVLALGIAQEGEVQDANVTAIARGISIVKLGTAVQALRLGEDTDLAIDSATFTPIDWTVEDEKDDDTFSHDNVTNPSRATVDVTGTFLSFASGLASRTGVNSVRKYPAYQFRENGTTIVQYGMGGMYNRGDQSTSGTFMSAHSAWYLGDLTANDYLEVGFLDFAIDVQNTAVFESNGFAFATLDVSTLFEEEAQATTVTSTTVGLVLAEVDAQIIQPVTVTADTVNLTLAEQDATVSVATEITATTVNLTLAFFDTTVSVDTVVTVTTPALTLTEFDTTILQSSFVTADTWEMTLTPVDASTGQDKEILVTTENLVLAEVDAGVFQSTEVLVTTTNLALAPVDAEVLVEEIIHLTTEALVLTPVDASVTQAVAVLATTVNLTLDSYPIEVTSNKIIVATTESLVLAEVDTSVSQDIAVTATTASLSLAEVDSTIRQDLVINASTGLLTLSEVPVVVTQPKQIQADTVNLTLTVFDATVDVPIVANTVNLSLGAVDATILAAKDITAMTVSLSLQSQDTLVVTGGDKLTITWISPVF